MRDLHDTLRAKELQLKQLEGEVETLRHALQILANEEARPRARKASGKGRQELAPGTVVTQPLMIRSVLLEKREPLHVDKIAEEIKRKYGVKLRPVYLASVIYRTIKKGQLFRKEGKNMFGLMEWTSPHSHQEPNQQNAQRLQ
jgi:hypothetical protein